MSIQQSVNQAISGSLFLLNQTDFFQRMKAIKSAEREMEVNKEVDKRKEGSDGSQEQVGVNTSEGNPKNNVDERVELARRQRGMFEDMMRDDMFYKLYKRAQADIQTQHNSEEFRKMILQGVYIKGDRWDGK